MRDRGSGGVGKKTEMAASIKNAMYRTRQHGQGDDERRGES